MKLVLLRCIILVCILLVSKTNAVGNDANPYWYDTSHIASVNKEEETYPSFQSDYDIFNDSYWDYPYNHEQEGEASNSYQDIDVFATLDGWNNISHSTLEEADIHGDSSSDPLGRAGEAETALTSSHDHSVEMQAESITSHLATVSSAQPALVDPVIEDSDIREGDEKVSSPVKYNEQIDLGDKPFRAKKECPEWKKGLVGCIMQMYRIYSYEMGCGINRAAFEINTVADKLLVLRLISNEPAKRRMAALAISARFHQKYERKYGTPYVFKRRPRSYAREVLDQNFSKAIKAVATQLKRSPRSAEDAIKKHLNEDIVKMLKNPKQFQDGIDSICKLHLTSLAASKILRLEKCKKRKEQNCTLI